MRCILEQEQQIEALRRAALLLLDAYSSATEMLDYQLALQLGIRGIPPSPARPTGPGHDATTETPPEL